MSNLQILGAMPMKRKLFLMHAPIVLINFMDSLNEKIKNSLGCASRRRKVWGVPVSFESFIERKERTDGFAKDKLI